jgi:hypothetical protein
MYVKNCCVISESSGQNAWTTVIKWEVTIKGRDGTCGSYGKKALNHQIFIVDYLQFVERRHRHVALYPTEYGASTVEKETAQKGISRGRLVPSRTATTV